MKHLITFILAVFSSAVSAADIFHLPYTKHFAECERVCPNKTGNGFNEQNYSTGIEHKKYIGFVMYNSHNRPSLLLGRMFSKIHNPYIKTFTVIGGATGYDNVYTTFLGIAPTAYVGIDLHPKHNKWGVVITKIPTPTGVMAIGFRLAL